MARTTCFGALWLFALGLFGCGDDIRLRDHIWACKSDADCLWGYVCVRETWCAPAGPADSGPAPEVPDAGADIGRDTAAPDGGSGCIPECNGRVCGDDGCGGHCGECGPQAVCSPEGTCDCLLCGDECCAAGQVCRAGACCTPQCTPGQCGPDGCDGRCPCERPIAAGPGFVGCRDEGGLVCAESEAPRLSNALPAHAVRLAAYAIDETETTVLQYAACVAAGACTPPSFRGRACNWQRSGAENHPMTCVSWLQAEQYCRFAGKRLCTEAEWERAARGGCAAPADCAATLPAFPWGDAPATCDRAIMQDPDDEFGCGAEGTWPGGSRPAGASPEGVFDLAGNVWEWVADFYAADAYANCPPPCDNPQGPATGSEHVYRGGSFYYGADYQRAYVRGHGNSYVGTDHIGIRCCRAGAAGQ